MSKSGNLFLSLLASLFLSKGYINEREYRNLMKIKEVGKLIDFLESTKKISKEESEYLKNITRVCALKDIKTVIKEMENMTVPGSFKSTHSMLKEKYSELIV